MLYNQFKELFIDKKNTIEALLTRLEGNNGSSKEKIEEQFMKEVGIVGKIDHFNLVTLCYIDE
jgi:hypothetical protein